MKWLFFIYKYNKEYNQILNEFDMGNVDQIKNSPTLPEKPGKTIERAIAHKEVKK